MTDILPATDDPACWTLNCPNPHDAEGSRRLGQAGDYCSACLGGFAAERAARATVAVDDPKRCPHCGGGSLARSYPLAARVWRCQAPMTVCGKQFSVGGEG